MVVTRSLFLYSGFGDLRVGGTQGTEDHLGTRPMQWNNTGIKE